MSKQNKDNNFKDDNDNKQNILSHDKQDNPSQDDFNSEEFEHQKCPMCLKETLQLTEAERDIPYFGKVFLYSMDCNNEECRYHKADVESAEQHEPTKFVIEVSGEHDMSIRVVKSAEATVKLPHIMNIEPGTASNGYVTNIEGILNRAKVMLEKVRDTSDEDDDRQKAKNMIKKLQRIMWGSDKIKITIEDPSGNSAIISDKAIKSKL
ncbi:ZPR1 zinc finger domain-containing protein [Candidatus Woesearchaeota archaeon]|nr:ZPR1 zinc finger domain-containing protein [Candidatus Woesearchaeota archaeon]